MPYLVEARKKKVVAEIKEKKQETPYQKFFKGKKCETKKGLFTLHKMDGKIYFELPLTLMERDMLLGSTVSEITDNHGESMFGQHGLRVGGSAAGREDQD